MSEPLQKTIEFLQQGIPILCTTYNHQPFSRPISSAMKQEGKIWFCMNTQKLMFTHIKANPLISICCVLPNYSWIRINAHANISDNVSIKECYLQRKYAQKGFKSIGNPLFGIIYLSEAEVEINQQGQKERFSLP